MASLAQSGSMCFIPAANNPNDSWDTLGSYRSLKPVPLAKASKRRLGLLERVGRGSGTEQSYPMREPS